MSNQYTLEVIQGNTYILETVEANRYELELSQSDKIITVEIGAQQGPPGPPGPQGQAGGAYIHAQETENTIWIINHNLGFYPDIAIWDNGGMEIRGTIQHYSNNQARILFNIAIAGGARLS